MTPLLMRSGERMETGKDACFKLQDGRGEQILYCHKGLLTVHTETGETFGLKEGQALCASGDFTGAKWIFQAERSVKAVFVPVKRLIHCKDSGAA